MVFLMVEVSDPLVRREMAPNSARAALLGVVCWFVPSKVRFQPVKT